jgi:hypothetical protein
VTRALVLAIALAVVGAPYARSATPTPRSDHVLMALATAGDEPYSVQAVEKVVRAADAFIRASSFANERLTFDVTPWLRAFGSAPGCGGLTDLSLDDLVAPVRTAAERAGYVPGDYNRIMYTIADSHCGFFGQTWGTQVVLTREPTVQLIVHELGHTFGLGHAQASMCPTRCAVDDTGDPYSPMGSGLTDFSVYEKATIGWIGRQPHARNPGFYTIAPGGIATTRPQALVIDTRYGHWWLEYRTKPFRGVLARFVDLAAAAPPFAPSPRLMLDPVHKGRPWIAAGETYNADGTFSVRVTKTRANSVRLHFARTGRRTK